MDPVQGNDSKEHKKVHIEDTVTEDKHKKPVSEHKPETERISSSSSSSSAYSSSDEDFFQIDPSEFNKQNPESSETTNDIPRPLQHDNNPEPAADVRSQNGEAAGPSGVVNRMDDGTMHPGSPQPGRPSSPDVSISSPGSDLLEPKQSPPVQVMGRSDVPDPDRIPSSIFARTKSTAPVEWSMASNESLFSIHAGNSSFSRDHVFLMGRSGELTNFSGSPSDLYSPLPPIPGSIPVSTDAAHGPEEPTAAEANAEAMKHVLRANAEVHSGEDDRLPANGAPFAESVSHRSDGSTASFAFPLLTGDGQTGSPKAEPEHPAPQPEQPNPPAPQTETPKAATPAVGNNGWFPCLSCCPFCS